jgi:hypothetical protein
MDNNERSGAHQAKLESRGNLSTTGYGHTVCLRAVLPNFISLTACVIVRDLPANARTRCASILSRYDQLPLLIRLRQPFSRHHTLRHVPKSLSKIFERRSRLREKAADLEPTSPALSTPDKFCATEAPRISPLSSSTVFLPFNLAFRCLVPGNLNSAAGTCKPSHSPHALPFAWYE